MNRNGANRRKTRLKGFADTLLLAVVILGAFETEATSDYRYEERLSAEIADRIELGSAVWLDADQRKFLAVYTESRENSVAGGVVILPDISGHADSRGLVRSLRSEFADRGWASMSLQPPMRRPGGDYRNYLSLVDDAPLRIRAAIDFLKDKKAKKILLVGHGLGAIMTLEISSGEIPKEIAGLVWVGMPLPGQNPEGERQRDLMLQFELPVLDIFGSRDLDVVLRSSDERRMIMKKNPLFRQFTVEGTDHEFRNETGLLFKRIYGWIMKSTIQKEKSPNSSEIR